MFKRKPNEQLPKHIEYSVYRREKAVHEMPPEDKIAIEKFYENNGVKHYDLPVHEHIIIFKRTVNFVYIVARIFAKGPNVHSPAKLGKDEGYGISRTKAFVFYRGIILYTLEHDYTPYPCSVTGHTTTNQKKCIKLNYGTHDELNHPILREIGKCCTSFTKFDGACHDLLRSDNGSQSINFIKEA
jgi:hypothetical protein